MDAPHLNQAKVQPEVRDGQLHSIGVVQVAGVALRSTSSRWLPYIDSYDGDVFRTFTVENIDTVYGGFDLKLRSQSDMDLPFRERRDASGDICLRQPGWDAEPASAQLTVHLRSASMNVGGVDFEGFRYAFSYQSQTVPIHRFIDRQTWELGGKIDGNKFVLRNWLTPPVFELSTDTRYSSVGLDSFATLLPGNLWGRWSLLPGFEIQTGSQGIMVGLFEQPSLIRSAICTEPGESQLRIVDLHYFEQSNSVTTPWKTILYSPVTPDDVGLTNLWTAFHDRDAQACRAAYGIERDTPATCHLSANLWQGINFKNGYEDYVDAAAELGVPLVAIDPVWQNHEALRAATERAIPEAQRQNGTLSKYAHKNMCCTLDFEVANEFGGETELKALCDRAATKGVDIISWISTHYSPESVLGSPRQNAGGIVGGEDSVFAARESGRHPDTGYASACWTLRLTEGVRADLRKRWLGVCERTGLKGYLWDSYCNLGWWQVDYTDGSMRTQEHLMARLYADLVNAGLSICVEAIVAFSNNSCCGLHGGNVYAGDLLGYSYNTRIGFTHVEDDAKDYEDRILSGKVEPDLLFRMLAHKRAPGLVVDPKKRDNWLPERVAVFRALMQTYHRLAPDMQVRNVLREDAGVLWTGDEPGALWWCFTPPKPQVPAPLTNLLTKNEDASAQPLSIYQVNGSQLDQLIALGGIESKTQLNS